jgi:uncharacterized protein with ATP-grasp and redox domains
MRMGPECPECLRNLARLTAELATDDPGLRGEMIRRAEAIISSYPSSSVPTDISNDFLAMIMEVSGNSDPFRDRKREEMERARRIVAGLEKPSELAGLVELAAIGNSLDFFLPPSVLEAAVGKRQRFALDHREELAERLTTAGEVLYIADNAGEIFFDIPLLEFLSRRTKVFLAVKERPVQNDLSLEDLKGMDLPAEPVAAPARVGVYLSHASEDFRHRFLSADLIISKGMGNYETLSEMELDRKCFFILRAKCWPVARSLGVRRGDYVAAFL